MSLAVLSLSCLILLVTLRVRFTRLLILLTRYALTSSRILVGGVCLQIALLSLAVRIIFLFVATRIFFPRLLIDWRLLLCPFTGLLLIFCWRVLLLLRLLLPLVLFVQVINDRVDRLPVFFYGLLEFLDRILCQKLLLAFLPVILLLTLLAIFVLRLVLCDVLSLLRLPSSGDLLTRFGRKNVETPALASGPLGDGLKCVLDFQVVSHLVTRDPNRADRDSDLKPDLPRARLDIDGDRSRPALVIGVHKLRGGETVVVGSLEIDQQLSILWQREVAFRRSEGQRGRLIRKRGDLVLHGAPVASAILVRARHPIRVVFGDLNLDLRHLALDECAPKLGPTLEHEHCFLHGVVETGLNGSLRANEGLDVAVLGAAFGQTGVIGRNQTGGHLHHRGLVDCGQLVSIRLRIAGRDVVVHLPSRHL